MTRSSRFELVTVEQRGYRVAHILDRKANRLFKVIHRLGRYRHFANDEPVTVRGLRDCAKEALADG
jgi:hypothetical protein